MTAAAPNWKKAKRGATHYGRETKTYKACWYKKVGGLWYFSTAGMPCAWHPMQNPPSKFRFGVMVKRPQP